MKWYKALLDFLAPIIASGKTRFMVTMAAIASETYMARYCQDTTRVEWAMTIVGIIAFTFVITKTFYDFYVVKKLPADKLGKNLVVHDVKQNPLSNAN